MGTFVEHKRAPSLSLIIVGPNRTTPPPSTGPVENRIVTRTIERHAAAHELLTQRRTLSNVSRILELDPKTVRRFARASDAHALISTARKGRSILRRVRALPA
ncbi:hypothetical protein [Rhodococcus rhodochrous]|uniref:hypothetical protein n=1 Tax=Rhodococcus rhodochrous TaxID=1829 RepID=UPI0011AA176D|nr:hypothetical protein [Rhodococcus rhodochrous]